MINRAVIASMRLAGLVLATLAAVASCGTSAADPAPEPTPLRILFIGNSLTYFNDLPALVKALGRGDPSRDVMVSSVVFGGYSLEDHWNRGDAQAAIAGGSWDFVVLQQGPSALPESRVLLVDYVSRFAAEIRRVGARPAVYAVWPPMSREDDWDAVTASYAAAAEAVDGLLLPGGEAIRAVRAGHPDIVLFQGDDFHPSPAGSYAVALVIFARAAGVSPIGLTARAGGSPLAASEVAVLEAAAARAIAEAGGD